MSSHRISASGERPYTLNAGGGPFQAFQVPSKRTDGISFQAQGFARVEASLVGNATRLEHYKVKGSGSGMEHDVWLLVIGDGESQNAGCSLYGYPVEDALDGIGGENTNLDVRKPGERFGALAFYPERTLVETVPLHEAYQSAANVSRPFTVEERLDRADRELTNLDMESAAAEEAVKAARAAIDSARAAVRKSG